MLSDANYKMRIGEKAKDFSLKCTEGHTHTLKGFDKKLLVLFFTCNHCPYAQAYENRINNLIEKYSDADFVGINSNDSDKYPDDSFEEMVKRKKSEGLKFTYLRDETQETAKAYGGECTPHFFVFNENRELIYQGRMDDNWKEPNNVTKKELEQAIKAGLKGEVPEQKVTNAIGCSIKWK